ncbi:Npt1/Npt2 family nucleotide transporter [Zeaxanthinibacter enoshimensis]|uniref:Npt1/Npt2 family nucleotide transporter n=1 Tax=Zeaxanthinibacter enoshimensis TaxID=392009 RepID=UPI003562096B
MLKTTLKKLFLLRDGEFRVSLLMQLYIFLIITVLLIVKPTVNALFLSELGAAYLPYGYMLTALIAMGSFYFYSKAVNYFSLRSIIYSTLVFFSACFILLSLLIHFKLINTFALFAYYISVSLFAVLTTSQFWLFANMVYNSREAKRLFGFIGAGAISGGIIGGYLTSIIASSLGNKFAILLSAVLLLICIPILHNVWRLRISKLTLYTRKQRTSAKTVQDSPAYKLILDSKHLSNLAGIVAVGVIVAKLVDFQFSDYANKLIPDPDDLASFFGFWFSTFNVLALLIQLLLTTRIMDRLGVASTLLLMPLALALGSLLFLTFPELWVLVLLKGIDGSFKQSVYKAALELSIMPVPFQVKNQAKSYIDVVVDSISGGVAGLLLYFVIRKMEIDTLYITILILLFLFAWIVLIYRLREAYFDSFRRNLKSSIDPVNKEKKGDRGAATLRHARDILTKGSEEEILTLLDKLDNYRLKALQSDIIALLYHPDSRVKTKTLKLLHFYDKGTASKKVMGLLDLEDRDVVVAAMEYILENTHINDVYVFNTYLDHPQTQIADAALLCLAQEATDNEKLGARYQLSERISQRINTVQHTPSPSAHYLSDTLLIIGFAGLPQFYPFIAEQLNNPEDTVVKKAIKAAGLTADQRFIEPLLHTLKEKKFRKSGIRALKNYGQEISRTLYSMAEQELLEDQVKPYLPEVIGAFHNQHSVNTLLRLLKNRDVRTRLASAKHLRKLKLSNPKLRYPDRQISRYIIRESKYYQNTIWSLNTINATLNTAQAEDPGRAGESLDLHIAREELLQILYQQLDLSFQAIFELLSIKYHHADIEVAYYGIKSQKEDTVHNALEFLDNLLHNRLKGAILPLLEYRILENPDQQDAMPALKKMNEFKCINMLVSNRGKRIKMTCLRIINELGDSKYRKIVRKLTYHKNPEVSALAKRVLHRLAIKQKSV